MREVVTSHAGKAMLGLGVMAAMILIPQFLNWVAATFALAWSVHHLRESFRIVDAEAESDDAADRFAA